MENMVINDRLLFLRSLFISLIVSYSLHNLFTFWICFHDTAQLCKAGKGNI